MSDETSLQFEHLLTIDDGAIGLALSALVPLDLALALSTASNEIREKLLKCIDEPDRMLVISLVGRMGRLRVCDTESAKLRILQELEKIKGVNWR